MLGPTGYTKAAANSFINKEIPAAKESITNTVAYFSETSIKQMGTDVMEKVGSPEFLEGTIAVVGSMAVGGPKGGLGVEMSLPIQEARYNLANHFYSKFGETNIESKLSGIDFTKAVETTTLKAGTIVEQWVDESGAVGKYFAPVGSDAGKLGIPEGKTMQQFKLTEDVKVLKSTAADYKGKKGGGTQYFNPTLKDKSVPVKH